MDSFREKWWRGKVKKEKQESAVHRVLQRLEFPGHQKRQKVERK